MMTYQRLDKEQEQHDHDDRADDFLSVAQDELCTDVLPCNRKDDRRAGERIRPTVCQKNDRDDTFDDDYDFRSQRHDVATATPVSRFKKSVPVLKAMLC